MITLGGVQYGTAAEQDQPYHRGMVKPMSRRTHIAFAVTFSVFAVISFVAGVAAILVG